MFCLIPRTSVERSPRYGLASARSESEPFCAARVGIVDVGTIDWTRLDMGPHFKLARYLVASIVERSTLKSPSAMVVPASTQALRVSRCSGCWLRMMIRRR